MFTNEYCDMLNSAFQCAARAETARVGSMMAAKAQDYLDIFKAFVGV